MYPESGVSGNPDLHRVAVVVPRGPNDEHWIDFAGRKLAERFGAARGEGGMAALEISGITSIMSVVMINCYIRRPLTELDMTIVYGIGQQVYEGLERDGVAVIIDGDVFLF